MTIIRRPSRFGDVMTLRQAMDRFFDDDFRPFTWADSTRAMPALPLDVTTDPDALTVEAALPGMKPEDVEITVENGTLTISGKTAEERSSDEGSHLVQEIRRGSFSRSLTLPQGLEPDKATATFEHGVLTLRIPKAEEVKPRQIRISPVTEGESPSNGHLASGAPAQPAKA
ncbi:MAG TPA: Hsp20/alpha crystallin family protein [Candidatus Limnocylindrales bacterium]|nr:Hsp20/alpha crystallin family protein [Candidatus Limnocylindrales bacterium]